MPYRDSGSWDICAIYIYIYGHTCELVPGVSAMCQATTNFCCCVKTTHQHSVVMVAEEILARTTPERRPRPQFLFILLAISLFILLVKMLTILPAISVFILLVKMAVSFFCWPEC